VISEQDSGAQDDVLHAFIHYCINIFSVDLFIPSFFLGNVSLPSMTKMYMYVAAAIIIAAAATEFEMLHLFSPTHDATGFSRVTFPLQQQQLNLRCFICFHPHMMLLVFLGLLEMFCLFHREKMLC
jgi:hypothetical protein